jgi:hypothetical protein
MSKRRGSGILGDTKGGDILRALAEKLKPAAPAPRAGPRSSDEELLLAFQRRQPSRLELSRIQLKKKQTKGPKKQILRAPPGQRAALLAAAEHAAPASSERPSLKAPQNDMGEASFQRITSLRSRLDIFSASYDGPDCLPSDSRELIRRRIALGVAVIGEIVDGNDGHFIGYDFGTSATKAVLRHPYRPGSAFAVPVPLEWASGGQPHLWPTAIWYDVEKECFSPVPEAGARCLHGFKSALIEGFGHRTCCGASVTMAEAAVAFIAFHSAYVIGAAVERDPHLKVAGINISVPVAALAAGDTRRDFERVARAGLSALPLATRLQRESVRGALVAQSAPSIPYALHAELSGAIAGYCTAPRYYLGGHMIIDCGSATLDMATFTLDKPNWPLGIYSARVEPLGADACLAYQVHVSSSLEECRRAARFQEHAVFRDTLAFTRGGFEQDRRKFPYQVILIGGGIHSAVHKPLFEMMETAFHRSFHRPTLATDLDFQSGAEPGRLILADGLARDPIELRKVVAMPGDRPPKGPLSRYPDPITKDQV